MGSKGNKPLKKENITIPPTLNCLCCNETLSSDDFYDSDSKLYRAIGKIPYCKNCLDGLYQEYLKEYTDLEYESPKRKAIERVCMALDIYYSDKIFDAVMKKIGLNPDTALIALYFKQVKLYQYRKKNYNTTIFEKYRANNSISMGSDEDIDDEIIEKAKVLFGNGLPNNDYLFLYNEYEDWTARHECQTKSQEEIFKAICFNRLKAYKANLKSEDTKDLDRTFKELLDTGKLQPKQNKVNTTAKMQTLGTLIDQYEETRPIPKVDDELKDVDKLGLFLDVFYRGHLAKMMGLKNGVSKYYDEYMKQFTVKKPQSKNQNDDENSVEEDSEAIFDALFGTSSMKED